MRITALFKEVSDSGAERLFDGEQQFLHLRSLVPREDEQVHVIGHVDKGNQPVSVATDRTVDASRQQTPTFVTVQQGAMLVARERECVGGAGVVVPDGSSVLGHYERTYGPLASISP